MMKKNNNGSNIKNTQKHENNRLIWFEGNIIPLSQAKINVLAPTSQFGSNVFEGIRAYYNANKKQLYIFRLEDHILRLKQSMKLFRMENEYSEDFLKEELIKVILANKYVADIAIRLTVYVSGFGSWYSVGPTEMFIAPIEKERKDLNSEHLLNCRVSTYRRINENDLSPRIKVGANYINSRFAHLEALDTGYDTAILLNDRGTVSEGPGSCIMIIKNNTLITPPVYASVLESITRDTLLEIAVNEIGIEIEIREILRTELYTADEAFLCGSAMEIGPIMKIDNLVIGDGLVGRITKKLHEKYIEIASGENSRYFFWLTEVK